jgi:hypothetical protein
LVLATSASVASANAWRGFAVHGSSTEMLARCSASRAYAFATTSPTSTLSKVIKLPGG